MGQGLEYDMMCTPFHTLSYVMAYDIQVLCQFAIFRGWVVLDVVV